MTKKAFCITLSFFLILSAPLGFCDGVVVDDNPAIQRHREPDIDFDSIQSFTTLQTIQGPKANELDRLVEKQLLFILRNQLELSGYTYEEDVSRADIAVMVGFNQTCADGNARPNIKDVGEALFGWLAAKQYEPDKDQTLQRNYDLRTNTKQVGYCYPAMAIKIFDNRYEQLSWTAIGKTTTNTANMSLSGQVFLLQLFAGFPEKSNVPNPEWYRLGFSMVIRTFDGLNFRPVVVKTWKGSPAQKIKLKMSDQMKSINGINVEHKPASAVRKIFTSLGEGEYELVILRDGKELVKKIKPLKMAAGN